MKRMVNLSFIKKTYLYKFNILVRYKIKQIKLQVENIITESEEFSSSVWKNARKFKHQEKQCNWIKK